MTKNDTAIMLITSILMLLSTEPVAPSDLSKMSNTSNAVLILGFYYKLYEKTAVHTSMFSYIWSDHWYKNFQMLAHNWAVAFDCDDMMYCFELLVTNILKE